MKPILGSHHPAAPQHFSIPPPWWARQGLKMVADANSEHGLVIISNANAASLRISRNDGSGERYTLAWSVAHLDAHSHGSLCLEKAELLRAFGYSDGHDPSEDGFGEGGEMLEERIGLRLSAAMLGRYARRGPYLNIPHPGTGLPGDPNISVYITPEIRTAVVALTG